MRESEKNGNGKTSHDLFAERRANGGGAGGSGAGSGLFLAPSGVSGQGLNVKNLFGESLETDGSNGAVIGKTSDKSEKDEVIQKKGLKNSKDVEEGKSTNGKDGKSNDGGSGSGSKSPKRKQSAKRLSLMADVATLSTLSKKREADGTLGAKTEKENFADGTIGGWKESGMTLNGSMKVGRNADGEKRPVSRGTAQRE